MRRVIGIVVLAIVATLGALVALPRLDPVCVAQMASHALRGDRHDWNCLAYAAARGDTRVVRRMLAAGVAVDSRTGRGATALLLSAEHGHLATLQLLLAAGARVNAHDDSGATALHRAARFGHAAVVRSLLGHQALVNARDRLGRTPLRVAAGQSRHADSEVAHVLVRAGANPEQADYRGNTPLMAAARSGHSAVLSYLLTLDQDIERRNDRGATALFLAVQGNHLLAARRLLSHGAEADTAVDGQAALQLALSRGHEQMANLLHASGASNYIRYASHSHLQDGLRRLNAGQPKAAINAFSTVITLQPDNARAFYWRAKAYAQLKKWRAARADLTLASSLAPPDAATLTMLARAYLHTGDNQQAIDTLEQLLRLAPDNSTAHDMLRTATARMQQAAATPATQ